ncbi:MAG TPA: helix-turn-helix domain-containing protein [Gemmatimonadales bacterium]|nr:helix-turn-helix domain-containing protein [Gemmatimonadales bacterium]
MPGSPEPQQPVNPEPRRKTRCRPPAPVNKLSAAERAHILATVNSNDFIDLPPVQIYARLLDEGIYLCSISTFYRVLEENRATIGWWS